MARTIAVRGSLLVLLCVAWPGGRPHAQAEVRSPRNANYTIEAVLDTANKNIEGKLTLNWRNIQSRPADELWFHLYWNAWRNSRSTWMIEDRIRGRSDHGEDVDRDDWGWTDVESIRQVDPHGVTDPVDLMPNLRFVAPDDGNPDDRTVMVVELPRPVEPGESVDVELTWTSRIPRTFARAGFRGDFYFIAHWFPKLGVFEAEGWNCHQFHASTEFFSDYGVYDVALTVPEDHVVGATGKEIRQLRHDDGTVTHRYRQEDVHGFTWTASPFFQVRERRFEVPGLPPVDVRLLIQPEHMSQADRHIDATFAALEWYGKWYGPYPYDHLTVVDPAWNSGAGGMEYPTIFTCGTRLINPFGGDSPEGVTVHEAGHQFWYGAVGNNEFEHAWLDEGLNTFSTIRTLETVYGPRILVRRYLAPPFDWPKRMTGLLAVRFPEIEVDRWNRRLNRYGRHGDADDPHTPSFLYYPETSASVTYDKASIWLATLERHLGWETLRSILSTYYERHRFGHPTPEDLFAVAEEVAGVDLTWFFDQVHRDSVSFDYAVTMADSVPAATRGWVRWDGRMNFLEEEEGEAGDEDRLFRTEVVVRRLGGGRFPVDVRLVFEDGHELRERWDGQERWKMVVAERPSRLDFAEVDPEHVLMLDTARLNNSRHREPQGRLAAAKWGSKWMIWLQDFLTTVAFFI